MEYSPARTPRPGPLALSAALLWTLGTTGCNSTVSPDAGQNEPGSIVENPATGTFSIVDASSGGLSSELRISRQYWGRLVDVYGLDSVGVRVLMNTNFVISPTLPIDNVTYSLDTNPVTAQQFLVILRDVTDTLLGGGRDQFFDKLKLAEATVVPIFDQGINGAGTFTMVPRNAAIVLEFDDLVDPQTLDNTTLRLLSGTPSINPFEARVFPDPNHGDLADFDGQDGLEFYSTRVVIDMTVSEVESFETSPPLPVNTLGLPASIDASLSNAQVRIPTRLDPNSGQESLIMNPSGHTLTTNSNGSVDFTDPTWDVVRAVRAGGASGDTGDPSNGFLPDSVAPRVVGKQNAFVTSIPISLNPPPAGDGTQFLLPTFTFTSEVCAQTPGAGDIITQDGGLFAEVIETPIPHTGSLVQNLKVRLLAWPGAWDTAGLDGPLTWIDNAVGPAEFFSPYEAVTDTGFEPCFVQIFPTGPDVDAPLTGIATGSIISVRFSEPMDPRSMSAFDAFTLTREAIPSNTYDFIVGQVIGSQNVQKFSFIPDLPLAHQVGTGEGYFLSINEGAFGPTDLAGNGLLEPLPQVSMTIDPVAAEQSNGGRVSRFSSMDEEPPFGGPVNGPIPEWAGQVQFDLPNERLKPRSVTRFQGVAARTDNLMIGAMSSTQTATRGFVQAPLSNFGAKTQMIWRFLDLGFELYDIELLQGKPMANQYFTNFNIDVEGLNWSPVAGEVLVDSFPEFEIRLSHAFFTPDEFINPTTGLPLWPETGLVDIFENNLLSFQNDPQAIVHEKIKGYYLNPGELYSMPGGMKLMPYPLNRDTDASTHEFYTYRDTALQDRAGPEGWGMYPIQWVAVNSLSLPYINCTGSPPPMPPFTPFPYYSPEQVQSIALPLLVEFRCYQSPGSYGINRFDTSMATNASTKPYFRAFSSGGTDISQNTVIVDPDTETRANGGFNPNSSPDPGLTIPGVDNEVYIGAVDFVVRVSRAVSIWFPATDPFDPGGPPFLANFGSYVIEPPVDGQPIGTDLQASFRGALNVLDNSEPREDAFELDLYGDHYLETVTDCFDATTPYPAIAHNPDEMNTPIGFLNSDQRWFDDPSMIDGASYYQVRMTFISNTQTGLSPSVSAFGLTWARQ